MNSILFFRKNNPNTGEHEDKRILQNAKTELIPVQNLPGINFGKINMPFIAYRINNRNLIKKNLQTRDNLIKFFDFVDSDLKTEKSIIEYVTRTWRKI